MVEPTTNEGGKKRHSLPAQETYAEKKQKTFSAARGGSPTTQEMSIEKKLKTSFAAHKGSAAAPKLVIDLTSSKSEKDEARSMLVAPVIPKATSSIADRIAQCRSSSVPQVLKFVPKLPSGVKSGSPLERLATMKSDKVPLPAKVVPKLAPSAVEIDSSTEKKETACAGNRERSTKFVFGEVTEVCGLLKPDLPEDIDVCAKFVDGVKRVVGPSSFAKHMTGYKKTA
ncbi:uncharacterized protein LOC126609362 [Malus sylvestris]|uniref:uncharacterized protein LOC126609362 n=1 Tax=Malus sylvestris TaxID=3752 RepID=UPI0021ABC34D|nr:uncharacterized protein LOC126609362 [Malus sylvestris]